MLKQVLIVSGLIVSLTGCIVAPYDDHPDRGRYQSNQYDKKQHRPDWRKDSPKHSRPQYDRNRFDQHPYRPR